MAVYIIFVFVYYLIQFLIYINISGIFMCKHDHSTTNQSFKYSMLFSIHSLSHYFLFFCLAFFVLCFFFTVIISAATSVDNCFFVLFFSFFTAVTAPPSPTSEMTKFVTCYSLHLSSSNLESMHTVAVVAANVNVYTGLEIF